VKRMMEGVTPGPWSVCIDDDGNPLSGRPSVQAPEYCDCAVVHWDGFVQEYWRSARGDKEIQANARFIAWSRDAVPALAARLAEVEAERDALAADGAGVFWANKARELAIHQKDLAVRAEMRAEAAEAKVARLTGALRAIAANKPTEAPTGATDAKGHCAWRSYNIARAALEETKE
jgi:hypothetical protein